MRVITGSARGVRLLTPDGMETRPTSDKVKEALFSIIQFEIEGRRALDLFAGTGQLGVEALSRGAKSCVFVDERDEAVKLVQENLRRAKLAEAARVVRSDYLAYLGACREKFDLIFLDPPYAEVFLENSLRKISEIDILSPGGIIICERPTEKADLPRLTGYSYSRDYRYGKTFLTVCRRESPREAL